MALRTNCPNEFGGYSQAMLFPSVIRGVIFDMDGVLCDSEPFICEAACRMFQQIHYTQVQPDDFKPFVGTGEDRFTCRPASFFDFRNDWISWHLRRLCSTRPRSRSRLAPSVLCCESSRNGCESRTLMTR